LGTGGAEGAAKTGYCGYYGAHNRKCLTAAKTLAKVVLDSGDARLISYILFE
jgi:hypothetical protein